jgi:hypothetical protein
VPFRKAEQSGGPQERETDTRPFNATEILKLSTAMTGGSLNGTSDINVTGGGAANTRVVHRSREVAATNPGGHGGHEL